MPPHGATGASIAILLIAGVEERSAMLRQLLQLVLPGASITSVGGEAAMEEAIPPADVALVDSGATSRATLDTLRFLRARGFAGGIVLLLARDDPTLRKTAQSLGAGCMTRSEAEGSPVELGVALTESMALESAVVAEVVQARRIFAAGQAALSLQHSINNPLAGLLAEAQLLQLESLTQEQREAVERMIELCRRVIALVRRLDVLATTS